MSEPHKIEYDEARPAPDLASGRVTAAFAAREVKRERLGQPADPPPVKYDNADGVPVVIEGEVRAQQRRDGQDYAVDRDWKVNRPINQEIADFRALCREKAIGAGIVDMAVRIATGGVLERVGDDIEGRPVYSETKNSDRMRAIEWLASNGWGLPRQSVEVDVNPGGSQATETGERVMERVMRAMAATLSTAPQAEQDRFLGLLGKPAAESGE